MARLTSALLVSALIRRVGAAGGTTMVIAKGDPTAGAVVLIGVERGVPQSLLERVLGADGSYAWCKIGPKVIENNMELEDYLARRRMRDPDLWVIELDIANAERFAAEMTGVD